MRYAPTLWPQGTNRDDANLAIFDGAIALRHYHRERGWLAKVAVFHAFGERTQVLCALTCGSCFARCFAAFNEDSAGRGEQGVQLGIYNPGR